MIRIAILDDEKADLEKEEQITRQYFYNRQAESEIATYQSVEWFLLGLTEEQFDIYILDAEMPVMELKCQRKSVNYIRNR